MYPESESYSPTTLYIVPSKIMRAVSPSPDLCICQIYILFLWHWPKNVLLCPSCFSLPQRKSCTIWCGGKKKSPSWKGRGEHSLYDLSQQIYSTWEKKMKQLYWKQMLTLCRLLKMERVLSVVAVTKRYWWQSRSLWCVTFPAGEDSRSSMRPKMKSACDFNVQETPRTKLVCCIFFPCRMHNIYLSCNIKAGKTS